MGGDGWLAGWPKRQKLPHAPPLAVCFHRVISRWPLLVLESPSPSHPQPIILITFASPPVIIVAGAPAPHSHIPTTTGHASACGLWSVASALAT
jgi:hypothetical protein